MNKVYKVVWNASLGIWVAVSELAKSKTKTKNTTAGSVQLDLNEPYQVLKQSTSFKIAPLCLCILTVVAPSFVMAEVNVGTGSSTVTSSTATSGTCGTLTPATISGTTTSPVNDVAIGCGNSITDMANSVAIGSQNTVQATNSTLQQIADRRGGSTGVNYATGATSYASAAVALGTQNTTGAGGGSAIGTANVISAAFYGVALGQGNSVSGGYGTAIGIGNAASATSAIAIGTAVQATGNTAIGIGRQTYSYADYGIALGNIASVYAGATNSVAIGNNSAVQANATNAVALGASSNASSSNAIAVGQSSVASGAASGAFGSGATASGSNALALGSASVSSGAAGVAIGLSSSATSDSTVALGSYSVASTSRSVAIGNGSQATANAGDVAIGSGSVTTASTGTGYITGTTAPTSVVSVGSSSALRRIQNVADGSADQDAVTVAQLKDVNNRAVGNTTALGGGAAYDASTDTYTAPVFTTTTTTGTTTTSNTVAGALSNLNTEVIKPITFAGNSGSSTNKLGSTLNISGGLATASSNSNVKTVVTGNTVDIQIANAPTFTGTVTAGNLATGGTLTVAGTSNLNGGANLNNQKITNLAAGTLASGSTDAVNAGQLFTTNQNVTTAQTTANTAVTNAAAAQSTANTALTTANKGLNFAVNGGTADNVQLGETMNMANGTNTTATYDAATNTYKYNLNDTISLTSAGGLTVGNTTVNNSGLTITGGPSVTSSGINAAGTKITNVAAGTLASGSTDAVNAGQLFTTNQNVTTAQTTANTAVTNAAAAQSTANTALTTANKGLNFAVNGGTADNVQLGETMNMANGTNTTATYDAATNTYKYNLNDTISLTSAGGLTVGNTTVNNSGLTITGGPSVTSSGISAAGTKITNLAAGTLASGSTDAVNAGQLFTTNQNVTTAQTTANTAVTNAATAQSTANKGLNFAVNGGTADNVQLGETMNMANGTNTTATYDAATNTYKYNLNDTISLTSAGGLTVGNTTVNNSGLTITGGPSVTSSGISAAGTKITNVAAGTLSSTSTDAVNAGQLFTTNQNVTTAQTTANTAVTNAATAQSTANTALTTANKGLNFAVNGGTADNVQLGETMNMANGTNTTATYDAATNTYKYNLNDTISLTSAGGLTVGNTTVNNSGLTITGGPSVSSTGINAAGTQISHLAAGAVTASSMDAVNGSQLYGVSNSVKDILGGNASVNTDGTVSTSNIGGTGVNTVDGAIAAVKDSATKAKSTVSQGDNIVVTSSSNADGSTNYNVATAKDLTVDSVTAGNSVLNTRGLAINDGTGNITNVTATGTSVTDGTNTTTYGANGFAIAGGPSVSSTGINAAGTQISHLAAGAVTASSMDAVNGSQLYGVSNSVKDILGGNASVNTDGTLSTSNIGGTGLNTVDGAIAAVKDSATKAKSTVSQGDNIVVTSSSNADGSTNYNVATAKDLTVDSVTAGNSVLNTRGLAINDGTGNITNVTATGTSVTDGSNTANYTATGNSVTDGSNTTTTTAAGTNVTDGTNTTTYGANGFAIAGGPSVSSTGINAAGTQISHLAAGAVTASSMDAVNGSQLYGVSNSVKDILGGNASVNTDGTLSTSNIGGTGLNTVDGAIAAVKDSATKAKSTVSQGDNIVVTSSSNADGSTNYNIATAKDLTVDSVTAGNSVLNTTGLAINDGTGNITNVTATGTSVTDGSKTTTYGADGFAIAGGPSVSSSGINAAGTQISHLAAGAVTASSMDAVNGSQLYGVSNSVKDILGGNASVNTDGTLSTSNIGGTGLNTVDGAIAAVKDSATKAKSTVSQGDNIVVTSSSNADGSTNYNVATAKDLTVHSVTAGNSVLNTTGLAINDGTGNITNVTATGTNVTDGTNTTNYGANGFAIAGGPSVSSTGINAGNTKITNLAAGTSDSDAVNVSQINKLLGIDINNSGGTNGSSSGYKIDGYDAVNTESKQTDLSGVKVSASQNNTTTQSVSAAIQALNTEVTKLQETNLGTKYFRVNSTEDDSLATGDDSIAIGTQSKAIGNQSIAIGVGNTVNGNNSGAIGDPTTINGNNSYSVGNNNTINTDDTFVLGNNVTQTTTGSVVLGANSAATAAAGEIGYASSLASSADLAAINATTSTTGAVAVGDASTGLYRQITGVAAGTKDSDAVNVAQLKAVDNAVSSVNSSLNQAGTSIANILGGGSVFNTDGSISNPTYTVAGTTQTTVAGALNALDQAITSATGIANAGWTLSANGTTQQIKPNSTVKFTGDQNVSVALDASTTGEGNVTVSLNKDLAVDSVTTGNTVVNNTGISVGSNVAVTSAGLVISGGPSVTTAGINAGGTTITNVAAGINATDAVNKSQLDAVAASAQATDNSAVKYDDSSTKSSITLGGANGTTISNVAAGAVTATSTDAVNGSQLYNVQQQVDQNTTDISSLQQSITNVTNGKSGLVQQASTTDTITVGKDTGGTSVSVAGTDGNRTVTGVKAGSITATSTDAVNGTQLYTSNQNVATYLGGGSVLDANGYVSAPTYSVAGGSYNNVGDALTAVDTRVANVEQALEQGFMATNNRINKLEDKLSAGIAATAALENAPYVPGKFTYAAGASAYNGQSAVGATLRRTADNGRWSMSGGVAASSQGDPLFRIGISGVID